MTIEESIIKHLIYDEAFTRKVLPFIKPEYFPDRNQRTVFSEIESFILKYNSNPTFESLVIELDKKGLSDDEYKNSIELLQEIQSTKDDLCKLDWLVDKTEKFCQDAAIYNGVVESIAIINGKSKDLDKGAIPDILTKALAVGFDEKLGSDYIEDAEDRFEYYHQNEERIPFDLDYFNRITNGGFTKGTLNLIVAATGVGKSLSLCHFASHYLKIGKNVLYITLEMSEKDIGKRIDANIMNVDMDDLKKLPKSTFIKKIDNLKNSAIGKIVTKQYPTGAASVNHFRALINELDLKMNFVPDIIIIDYLNIAKSSRLKASSAIDSYNYIKAVAEEFRGLAVEKNVPIFSATQFNRGSSNNSDPDIGNISESFGTAMTVDFLIALIATEELLALNQLMVKQLKSRYGDTNYLKRFVIGVDKAKSKLYDVESSAQIDIADQGLTAAEVYAKSSVQATKNKFESFKI